MMHPRKGEFFSSRVRYISLNQIRPNPQQPRRSFDEDSLSELAESIRRYGIPQRRDGRLQGQRERRPCCRRAQFGEQGRCIQGRRRNRE